MHYALDIVNLGYFADPRNVVRLARVAEEAGWEGLFVWDHLGFVWGAEAGDPWVILSAVAATTVRLKLGTAVTPLPRRRPQVLAQTLATLDLLSVGRVILGCGSGGVPEEFAAFGEPSDAKLRAGMLDEHLAILHGLLSGEQVNYQGTYYSVKGVSLSPLPVQKPRIPIWIGGDSRPALRRAARWDGWVTGGDDEQSRMAKSPQQIADQIAYIRQHRTTSNPFDVAMTGCSTPKDALMVGEYEDAGITWWLESMHGYRGALEEMIDRAKAGPPVS